jgi:hypothetical protein
MESQPRQHGGSGMRLVSRQQGVCGVLQAIVWMKGCAAQPSCVVGKVGSTPWCWAWRELGAHMHATHVTLTHTRRLTPRVAGEQQPSPMRGSAIVVTCICGEFWGR